jgi:hypothetical protein
VRPGSCKQYPLYQWTKYNITVNLKQQLVDLKKLEIDSGNNNRSPLQSVPVPSVFRGVAPPRISWYT